MTQQLLPSRDNPDCIQLPSVEDNLHPHWKTTEFQSENFHMLRADAHPDWQSLGSWVTAAAGSKPPTSKFKSKQWMEIRKPKH